MDIKTELQNIWKSYDDIYDNDNYSAEDKRLAEETQKFIYELLDHDV